MITKIKKFLFENYHRPSAKLEHLQVFIKKLFYNKKTVIFSERIMLEKNPPETTIFYNLFGRITIYVLNLIYIIFFNRFYNSITFLDETDENGNYKSENVFNEGEDSIPWPIKQLIKKKLIVKKSKMNFIQKFMKSILFFVTNLKIQNLKRQIGG